MKIRILVIATLLLLTSCEKGETDDTILKFFSKAYKDSGNSIAVAKESEGKDMYYFICGQLTDTLANSAPGRAGVIKAGPDGNMIGSPAILGNTAGSASRIIILGNGDIVCTGYVLNTASEKDLFVWHLSSGLAEIAYRVYNSAGNQYGVDIIETEEGFLVLGTTDVKREPATEVTGNAAGKKDILLMRVNRDLQPFASIPAVGYIGNDEGVAIKKDLSGGYIVVGTTDRSDRPASEQAGTNIIILRVNADGSTTQPRILGGTLSEAASDFEVLNDGYLIAGTTGNPGTTQQGYIWKMPVDIYASPVFEHAIDIDPSSSVKTTFSVRAMCRYKTNSFLLAGQYGTGLSARLLVFSVDAFGVPVEGRKKITGGSGTQIANDVISGDSDNIITVGTNSYESNSMICFLKFRF